MVDLPTQETRIRTDSCCNEIMPSARMRDLSSSAIETSVQQTHRKEPGLLPNGQKFAQFFTDLLQF